MRERENEEGGGKEFLVHVYHVPMTGVEPTYVFAEDEEKGEFFLHRSALSESERWAELCNIGTAAYIEADSAETEPGKVPRALAIRLEEAE